MAEVKSPVEPINVDYKCDKCDQGYMRPTGNKLLCSPPKYPHICTKCDNNNTFLVQYPHVTFVNREGEKH